MTSLTKKPRILIVEDEAIVARDIQLQLTELGYEPIAHATRGDQSIALADELRPDLVLMDIQLAGPMDGIAAAQAIREKFFLPVVFLTAFAADEVLARAKLTEPFGYIVKPFSERELRTVIEMALYKYQAEAKLRDSARHTHAILDNVVDGIITFNADGQVEFFNRAAGIIFGYAPEDILGSDLALLLREPYRSSHQRQLQHFRRTGEAGPLNAQREIEGQRKDGSAVPLSMSVSSIRHGDKPIFIGNVRDITHRLEGEERIRNLANYDTLTHLPNRRMLKNRLSLALASSARTHKYGALLLLDLDNFKQINDTRGHAEGDELLELVAQRLQGCVGESHCVARLGGDEFLVLLEALDTDPLEAAAAAQAIGNRILAALGTPYEVRGLPYISTPSIGIAMFMHDQGNKDDLLKEADVAMYQAKAAGRNTLRFFDPKIQAAAKANADLENDLRQGLARKEFLLHYQIQVNRFGTVSGAEALVRWNSRRSGMVPPNQFIPLAEASGLILPLGQWVLETACLQLREWADHPDTATWTMAVNVSPAQFAQDGFVASVSAALQESGADPRLLKLELTESMLVNDVEDIIIKMNQIKALGVSFSLDDFGTGFSSLSYLKRLPLDQLKIDQSFVRDILSDQNDAVIARTVLALGHSLGLQVIAEGVETAEQLAFLVKIGCDAFQGYHFGRPVAADALSSAPAPNHFRNRTAHIVRLSA